MNKNNSYKTMKAINWYFIIIGGIEIFAFVFLTHKFYAAFFGLITLFPAYLALNEKKVKWNYFVSIWAIIKSNPVTSTALVAFILGDLFKSSDENLAQEITWPIVLILLTFALIVLSTFVLSIVLLIKTQKYINEKNQNSIP